MLRVRTVWSGVAGQPYYTNMYFDTSPGTAEGAVDAVAAFWTACGDVIQNGVRWTVEGEVLDITTNGTITGVVSVDGATGLGEVAGNFLPTANQLLVQLRTGAYAGNRAIRGRIFIPGQTENNTSGGDPSTGARQVAQDAAEDLIAGSPGFGVWSRKNGLIVGVTSASVWNKYAVLRSRRD